MKHDAIAAKIAFVLEKSGLSQEALAATLGVTFASVNRWLHGKFKPHCFNKAAIDMLKQAFEKNDPEKVVIALRESRGDSEAILRALVHLTET